MPVQGAELQGLRGHHLFQALQNLEMCFTLNAGQRNQQSSDVRGVSGEESAGIKGQFLGDGTTGSGAVWVWEAVSHSDEMSLTSMPPPPLVGLYQDETRRRCCAAISSDVARNS